MHKDVKPLNLVFDGAGYLRLTDFGISKEIKSEEQIDGLTGDQHGTLRYMAPEVLKCRKYHKSADFWAVGVTALQIAGYPTAPFPGSNK